MISGYQIAYRLASSSPNKFTTVEVGSTVRQFTATDLTPESAYIFRTSAKTRQGWGEPLEATVITTEKRGNACSHGLGCFPLHASETVLHSGMLITGYSLNTSCFSHHNPALNHSNVMILETWWARQAFMRSSSSNQTGCWGLIFPSDAVLAICSLLLQSKLFYFFLAFFFSPSSLIFYKVCNLKNVSDGWIALIREHKMGAGDLAEFLNMAPPLHLSPDPVC